MTGKPTLKGSEGYEAIVDRLKLRDEARRGSGVLTALAAVGLIWCEPRAERARSASQRMRLALTLIP